MPGLYIKILPRHRVDVFWNRGYFSFSADGLHLNRAGARALHSRAPMPTCCRSSHHHKLMFPPVPVPTTIVSPRTMSHFLPGLVSDIFNMHVKISNRQSWENNTFSENCPNFKGMLTPVFTAPIIDKHMALVNVRSLTNELFFFF